MTSPSDQQNRLSIISEFLSQSHNTNTETTSLANDVKKLDVKDPKTLEGKVDAYCREFLSLGDHEAIERNSKKQPETSDSKQNAGPSS